MTNTEMKLYDQAMNVIGVPTAEQIAAADAYGDNGWIYIDSDGRPLDNTIAQAAFLRDDVPADWTSVCVA